MAVLSKETMQNVVFWKTSEQQETVNTILRFLLFSSSFSTKVHFQEAQNVHFKEIKKRIRFKVEDLKTRSIE